MVRNVPVEVEPGPLEIDIRSVTDLGEICGWLGTYRERLRLAKGEDKDRLAADVRLLSNRFQERRAELA